MSVDLKRGEAMKVGALTVVSAGAARVAHELRRVGVELPIPGEYSFARAEPRFKIWYHAIKSEDVLPNTVIVTGETLWNDINWHNNLPTDFPPDTELNTVKRIFSSSTFVSNQELMLQARALCKVPHILCTDDQFVYTATENKYGQTLEVGQKRAMLGTIIAEGVLTLELIAAKKKNGVNTSYVGPISAMGHSLEVISDKLFSTYPNFKKYLYYGIAAIIGKSLGDVQLAATNIPTIIDSIYAAATSVDDDVLINLIELTSVRNISMPLNSINSLELFDQLPESAELAQSCIDRGETPDVLFFAGTGHLMAKENYERGVQYCESQMTDKIRNLISKYYQAMEFNRKNGADEKNTDLLKELVQITGFFNFPYATFMNTRGYLDTYTFPAHLSPRALMWKFISRNQAKDQDNPTLKAMVGTLIREDFAAWSAIDQVVPTIRMKAQNPSACQEYITVTDENFTYEYRIVDGIPVILNLTN